MSLRLFRRKKLLPGVTLNLSKSGPSLSLGPRGAKVTLGSRGVRGTVGLPGTGIYYTKLASGSRKKRRGGPEPAAGSAARAKDRLNPGFFQRLFIPEGEEALIDGLREFVAGRRDAARLHLRRAANGIADAAFVAGVLAAEAGDTAVAVRCFTRALERPTDLGKALAQYGVHAGMRLRITEELEAEITPSLRGVLLALVECHQEREDWAAAADCLKRLRRLEPDDVLVKVSLAEILLETRAGKRDALRQVVKLAEGVENESAVHGALLLYKARALRALGLLEAAKGTLTVALRRKKDRPDGLLHALRYERALVYEGLGHAKRSRADLERLYAAAPDYADVAVRLGM